MLKKSEKQTLKSRLHHLHPVVIVGQHGVTEAVQQEIAVALNAHELIKIKLNAGDKAARDAMIAQICDYHQADEVARIGHVVGVYKLREE